MSTKFNFQIGENFISAADIVPSADVRETTFLAYLLKERGYTVSRLAESCVAVMLRSEEEVQKLNEEIHALLTAAHVPADKEHWRKKKQIDNIYLTATKKACAEMWPLIEPNLNEKEIVYVGKTSPYEWNRFRFAYPESAYKEDWKQSPNKTSKGRSEDPCAAPTK